MSDQMNDKDLLIAANEGNSNAKKKGHKGPFLNTCMNLA